MASYDAIISAPVVFLVNCVCGELPRSSDLENLHTKCLCGDFACQWCRTNLQLGRRAPEPHSWDHPGPNKRSQVTQRITRSKHQAHTTRLMTPEGSADFISLQEIQRGESLRITFLWGISAFLTNSSKVSPWGYMFLHNSSFLLKKCKYDYIHNHGRLVYQRVL